MPGRLVSILRDAKYIVISTHTRPDGDAIGSQVALGLFLKRMGKEVTLLNSDPTPYNMEWLTGTEVIQAYDGSLGQLEAVQQADAIIVVDTNGEKRLGDVGSSIRSAPGKKILIDHHPGPEDWFDAQWIRETASSAGELVYEILQVWSGEDSGVDASAEAADGDAATAAEAFDANVARALYVAIMTDTGSFRFSHVTPRLHRLVADLIDRGNLDVQRIYAEVYETRSIESIRLLSQVLSTLTLWHDGQVGTMAISRRMLQETGAAIAEADGFVNHILTIHGVRVAIMFTETARGTKASFRSKEEFEVHRWAASLGGGGHRYASGAFVKEALEPATQRVMKSASRFLSFSGVVDDSADALDADDAVLLESLKKLQEKFRTS